MRKALWALAVCGGLLNAQDALVPAAADLLPITEAVRDYYRAQDRYLAAIAACVSCQAAAQERDAARQRAQQLQEQLQKAFACKLDLDTNVCTATAEKESK